MRIVIDMQGAQSDGSWNRGIGRYTLALATAIVRNRGEHEVFLVLNGAFPKSIQRIRIHFETLLPKGNIRVWAAPSSMARSNPANDWRRKSGELIREAFLAHLMPDAVVVTSLFEGFGDDAVTSVGGFSIDIPTGVVLYDLIPLINRDRYLESPALETWYLEKLDYLRRADCWLAISESSRREGLEHLGLPQDQCINISADADPHFKRRSFSAEELNSLQQRFGLARSFVMYTGGIDHRKNIEGLIRAYARLPPELRADHQLAIVCSARQQDCERLLKLAGRHGLVTGEVVLTGFVLEEDLIALYNLCSLFVFPSWHEGFGLPVLEAMRCGAPVIAANASSLPEVVGLEEALFDPHSDAAITRSMERALTDVAFRERLMANGNRQASKFSWDETARRAITTLERVANEGRAQKPVVDRRLRLAYISPLPPERSGISDYSAELLPALANHYDIEVIVAQKLVTDPWVKAHCPIRSVTWFKNHKSRFDRVLYHFGNSAFHKHMFELLREIPGVVVLHDFYLSGVLHHMDATGYAPGCFEQQLYHSHGYGALADYARGQDIEDLIRDYPCSREVIENSVGIIVHSKNSVRLAKQWYGLEDDQFDIIPHMRIADRTYDRTGARRALGFSDSAFVVCSFGILAPKKLNDRLLEAWLASNLATSSDCHLIFVGANSSGEYGKTLSAAVEQGPHQSPIRITGWVDKKSYRQYLAAADLGVQLRTLSRGETSGTVLDCMNYGLATIVNANGSMADLAPDSVWKMPDEFSDSELTVALETLWHDQVLRRSMGIKARRVILQQHDPNRCAAEYKAAIDRFYDPRNQILQRLLRSVEKVSCEEPITTDLELSKLSTVVARVFPPQRAARQLLIDISELICTETEQDTRSTGSQNLKEWILHAPAGWRVEPVRADPGSNTYRYARAHVKDIFGFSQIHLGDDPVDYGFGDVVLTSARELNSSPERQEYFQMLENFGVQVKMVDKLLMTPSSWESVI